MGCGASKAAEAVVEVPTKPTAQELAKAEQERARKERIGESPEPLPDFVPYPGFVVKTKRTNTFQKAFINVMHHELVPTNTRYVTRDEQWKVDKKGENCIVFTAVIPTTTYVEMARDPQLPPQVCAKIITLLNDLYPLAKLDLDYSLPKIKQGFMGDDIDLITSDPEAAKVYAAQKEERLAAAAAATAVATASVGAGSSQKHAVAAGPLVNPHETLAATMAEERAHNIHVPPKMQGWLKKRGHIVVNWKTRYFVLDSGYLSYFMDQLDEPPFGKDKKGQICLAGYRIVHAGTPGKVTSADGDAAAAEFQYRIQLALMDASYQERTGGKSDYEELMVEAATLEEKLAWIAAINAHTNYVEASLKVAIEAENRAAAAAPIALTNDPKPWMVYVDAARNEGIVLCGVVNKPNPVGKQMMRELILTTAKRLIYVDVNTLELKGTIEWRTENGVEPFVKIVNATTFEVHHAGENKTYKFITRDDLTAKNWVDAINSVKL